MPLTFESIKNAPTVKKAKDALDKKRDIHLGWVAAPLAGQIADTVTTAIALKNGAVEGNPLMKDLAHNKLPLFAALKLGIGLASGFLVKTLAQSGHKKAAKVLSMVTFGTGALPAANNLMVIKRSGEK